MGNTSPRDIAFNNTFNQKYILNTAANSFGSAGATAATGGPRFKEDHIFTDFLELERDLLPTELFVLILSFVELKTICIVIPQVCKALFNEVSANSSFWQAKVKAEKPVQQKRDEQTWKQLYLIGYVKLFPVLGLEIATSTIEDVSAIQDTVITTKNHIEYLAIMPKKCTLVLRGQYKVVLWQFCLLAEQHILFPAEWEAKGLTWNKSLNGYKKFASRWFGDKSEVWTHDNGIEVTIDNPGRKQFLASITSEVLQDSKNSPPYKIDMRFEYDKGEEDKERTLASFQAFHVPSTCCKCCNP